MENVVPIEKLPEFIREAIMQVNRGLYETREAGILVEMPDSLQISAMVIKEWQPEDLGYNSNRISTDNGTQSSTSNDAGASTSTDTQNSTSNDTGTSNSTDTGTSNSTDSGNNEGSSTQLANSESETTYSS
jgi:hypothetical protein